MKHSFVKRAISVLLVVGLLATFAVVQLLLRMKILQRR